jgi:hypothetical protein
MTLKQWLAVDAPAGWTGVIARTVTTTIVGFVVFQLKEWAETGGVDTPDAVIGAGWLALVMFVAAALHMLTRPPGR